MLPNKGLRTAVAPFRNPTFRFTARGWPKSKFRAPHLTSSQVKNAQEAHGKGQRCPEKDPDELCDLCQRQHRFVPFTF